MFSLISADAALNKMASMINVGVSDIVISLEASLLIFLEYIPASALAVAAEANAVGRRFRLARIVRAPNASLYRVSLRFCSFRLVDCASTVSAGLI